jgi:hypothetical protein
VHNGNVPRLFNNWLRRGSRTACVLFCNWSARLDSNQRSKFYENSALGQAKLQAEKIIYHYIRALNVAP